MFYLLIRAKTVKKFFDVGAPVVAYDGVATRGVSAERSLVPISKYLIEISVGILESLSILIS